jgi:glycosyltransferase involved in cell wall biosynthesis
MKIVVVSTTIMQVPPSGYSGLEMLAWLQAKGLAEKGHEVLLVAPIGSTPPPGVELHGTTLGEPEQQAWLGYRDRLPKFDVIVTNSWAKWEYISKIHEGAPYHFKGPVLGVLHAPCHTMYGSPPPVPFPCFVAISQDQAAHAGELWGVACRIAYNGIDLNHYRAREGASRNGRYLFLARFSSIKGAHIAVDVARRTRVPLDLVGDDRLTGEPAYVQRIIAQAKASPNVAYVGPVSREQTVDYYSSRKALLHPNQHYREPFGLAPVEAEACGMGVIAFDNGAMRETLKHDETGFLVKTPDEIVELVKADAVSTIKPDRCREWASQFSVERMVVRYEELAREALDSGGW